MTLRVRETVTALAFALLPSVVAGQLSDRVRPYEDGAVRFSYEARPEVEVCEEGVRMGEHHMMWRFSDGVDGVNCRRGWLEVEVQLRSGVVQGVEIVRSPRHRASGGADLGEVAPGVAAEYLLSLAWRGATPDAAEEAIAPAMLADVPDTWRDVLDIARNKDVHSGVRKNALFWLGQSAAERVADDLGAVATGDDEDQEVRDAAVFALSQLKDDQGVPILMDLARTADESETRRKAMFWLAQSDDPRVVPFFEEILLRGGA